LAIAANVKKLITVNEAILYRF